VTAQPWRDRTRRLGRIIEAEQVAATDPGRFIFYVLALLALAAAVIAAQLGAWILTAACAGLAAVAGVEPRLAAASYRRGYSTGWNAGWDDRTITPRGPRSGDQGQFFSEGDSADTP